VNLITTPDSIPPYWQKSVIVWKYRRGDPIGEEIMLKERSPLFNVDKIKIPMFIAHGAHDVRIKQTDSDKIVAALRERNVPCEYLLFSNEGHGLNSLQNRMQLYGAIESFLAQHLKGQCERV
jgi:dipeptidyl aminopeptidase/acylaminoacyl peptidase